ARPGAELREAEVRGRERVVVGEGLLEAALRGRAVAELDRAEAGVGERLLGREPALAGGLEAGLGVLEAPLGEPEEREREVRRRVGRVHAERGLELRRRARALAAVEEQRGELV